MGPLPLLAIGHPTPLSVTGPAQGLEAQGLEAQGWETVS